jgi:heat shock protein HslJ
MKTRALLIIGLGVLAAACGSNSRSSSSAPTTVLAASLSGRAFIATEVIGHKIVPGTMVSLAFNGGALTLSAGCNSMGGGYKINNGVLTVSNLVMTEIGCAEVRAAQDKWLSDLLAASPELVTGDKSITLKSGATVVKLTDKQLDAGVDPVQE